MSGRPGALILALLSALPAHSAELSGSWRWDSEAEDHGGYSGIEVAPDGLSATVISDRGQIVQMRLSRDGAGQIDGLSASLPAELALYQGTGALDTEGLAVADDGTIWISLEGGRKGLLRYDAPDALPEAFPPPEIVTTYPTNRRLEGLAIAPAGTPWSVAETPEPAGFRVQIFEDGAWTPGPLLPERDGFVPVGLDFDDRGRLYLLERMLSGIFGFRSRVRRFTLDGPAVATEEELLATAPGVHDNLEGISVWRNATGDLVATMISDDNFFALQKTEIVEYVLPD